MNERCRLTNAMKRFLNDYREQKCSSCHKNVRMNMIYKFQHVANVLIFHLNKGQFASLIYKESIHINDQMGQV